MYRVASRVPRRAVLAAATGLVLTENRDKLSIYPSATPDVLLVETSSPLEEQIGVARRQVQGVYADGYSYVQGWVAKWIGIEHAVENRVKSIISPTESLTPGLLYVGVSTLTGSILARNRFILTRLVLPPLFLIASAHHFLPETTANLSAYLGSLEEQYAPEVARKHEIAKAHSAMGWEMLKDKTKEARETAEGVVERGVEKVQSATGLKIKETLGLGQQAPVKKVERKVLAAVHAAEDRAAALQKKVVEAVIADAAPAPVAPKVDEVVVDKVEVVDAGASAVPAVVEPVVEVEKKEERRHLV